MLKKIYIAIGAMLIGMYATTSLMGWEFGETKVQKTPSHQRHMANGRHRSGGFFFGGSSFGGGK